MRSLLMQGSIPVLAFTLLEEVRGLSAIAETFLAAVLVGMTSPRGLVDPYLRCCIQASWPASFALITWVLRAPSTGARVVRSAEA